MGPWYGHCSFLSGSGLWALFLKAVENGVMMILLDL